MACFDAWDIGACGCTSAYPVTCKGCSSIVFASGQSIQVWDHSGGTLLNTYTTNSSGQISVPTGTYYFIPSNGRFAGGTVTVGTGTNTASFGVATGYQCCTQCAQPLSTTIHATFTVKGALTLTAGGTPFGAGWGWTSGALGAYMVLSGTWYLTGCSGGGGIAGTVTSCPPSLAISMFVFGGCATTFGQGTATE